MQLLMTMDYLSEAILYIAYFLYKLILGFIVHNIFYEFFFFLFLGKINISFIIFFSNNS